MSWYILTYFIILALGILTGALRYHILLPACRYFFALLIVTVIAEAVAWYVSSVYHSNLLVYRLLIPVQYLVITLGYRSELKILNWIVSLSIFFVVIIWTFDFIQSFNILDKQYPTLTRTVCNIFIISWTLIYLNSLLRTDAQASFTEFPLFWLSVGWLLFSAVNLTYFATVNYLGLHGQNFLKVFSNIRVVLNFVLYSLFIISFLSKQRSIQQTK